MSVYMKETASIDLGLNIASSSVFKKNIQFPEFAFGNSFQLLNLRGICGVWVPFLISSHLPGASAGQVRANEGADGRGSAVGRHLLGPDGRDRGQGRVVSCGGNTWSHHVQNQSNNPDKQ